MKRLQAVLELLPRCCVLADIGCDHGLLTLAALESGKAERAYACDVSAPSLRKAEKALKGRNAECIVSDGFASVPKDFTAAVISGMGCKTMLDILDGYDGEATLILQPQTQADEVRKVMTERGYRIDEEITALERGRYYSVMRFVRGGWDPTPLQIMFGLRAERGDDPILIEMCRKTERKYSRYPRSERTDAIIAAAQKVIAAEIKSKDDPKSESGKRR